MSYRGRGGRGRDRRTDDVKQRLRDKLQQGQNETKSDDRDAESSSNRSQSQNYDKPPPGLRGRDIGMWYARRNKERRDAGEAPPERRKVGF